MNERSADVAEGRTLRAHRELDDSATPGTRNWPVIGGLTVAGIAFIALQVAALAWLFGSASSPLALTSLTMVNNTGLSVRLSCIGLNDPVDLEPGQSAVEGFPAHTRSGCVAYDLGTTDYLGCIIVDVTSVPTPTSVQVGMRTGNVPERTCRNLLT